MAVVGLGILIFIVIFALLWIFQYQLEPQLETVTSGIKEATKMIPSEEESRQMGERIATPSEWFQ
jgi:hypothetical protein